MNKRILITPVEGRGGNTVIVGGSVVLPGDDLELIGYAATATLLLTGAKYQKELAEKLRAGGHEVRVVGA